MLVFSLSALRQLSKMANTVAAKKLLPSNSSLIFFPYASPQQQQPQQWMVQLKHVLKPLDSHIILLIVLQWVCPLLELPQAWKACVIHLGLDHVLDLWLSAAHPITKSCDPTYHTSHPPCRRLRGRNDTDWAIQAVW